MKQKLMAYSGLQESKTIDVIKETLFWESKKGHEHLAAMLWLKFLSKHSINLRIKPFILSHAGHQEIEFLGEI